MSKLRNTRDEDFYSLVKLAKVLAQKSKTETDEKYMICMIRNAIFSLPSVYTRLISKEALELKDDKRTKEHFYSRNESAKRLVYEIRNNPKRSNDALVAFLKSRSRVHKVTGKQNNLLKQYNKKNPGVHWRKAYKDCNIELINHIIKKDNNKKYNYYVGNTEYKSISDVAAHYGISIDGARYRFFKSKNHPHWRAELISK